MDYDALERLARLRDQGVLTEEEFSEQKYLLLNPPRVNYGSKSTSVKFMRWSVYQKLGVTSFAAGALIVLYSTFMYDVTVSQLEVFNARSPLAAATSLEEKSAALRQLSNALEAEIAGERYINYPRVETQKRMFSFGVILMVLGGLAYLMPIIRSRQT